MTTEQDDGVGAQSAVPALARQGIPGEGEAGAVLPPRPHLYERPLPGAREGLLDVAQHELDIYRGFQVPGNLLRPVAAVQTLIRLPSYLHCAQHSP